MLFVRSILKEIIGRYLIAFLVLVIVFAVEKFDFIVRLSLEYGLDLRGFVILFLSDLPTVMDMIIPIATIVAFYITILNIRERREFIILAAAGVGSRPVLMLSISTALVAALTSFAVAGFVKPAANYAFRTQYERSLSELVSKGPEGGRFFETPDTVVYTSPATSGGERKLRVFGFEGPRVAYVYLSDCARMHIEAGLLYSDTCATRAYQFKRPNDLETESSAPFVSECPECGDERSRLSIVRITGRRTEKAFDLQTLFKTIERDRIDERSVFELLDNADGTFVSKENALRGVKDLLIAAVNVFAVACALVAVAFTTQRTRFFALPLAIALLLGAIVVVGSGSTIPAAAVTPTGVVLLVLAAYACCFGLLFAVAHLLRDLLVTPRTRRA